MIFRNYITQWDLVVKLSFILIFGTVCLYWFYDYTPLTFRLLHFKVFSYELISTAMLIHIIISSK